MAKEQKEHLGFRIVKSQNRDLFNLFLNFMRLQDLNVLSKLIWTYFGFILFIFWICKIFTDMFQILVWKISYTNKRESGQYIWVTLKVLPLYSILNSSNDKEIQFTSFTCERFTYISCAVFLLPTFNLHCFEAQFPSVQIFLSLFLRQPESTILTCLATLWGDVYYIAKHDTLE